jgi:hypothetical protein
MEVPDAGHGAHLSHPSAFAVLVLAAVALGDPAGGHRARHGGTDR